MKVLCKHYLISGRVQGVGFRAYTRALAESLRVRGWVRNLADGRVEALALGEDGLLQAFVEGLHRGPQFARVDSVQVTLAPQLHEDFTHFELKKDGPEPCLDTQSP